MGSSIRTVFEKSQHTIHHTKLVEKLFDIYIKTPENDFKKEFLLCLKISLASGDKTQAVRVLDFVSRFCALLEEKKNDPEMKSRNASNHVENGHSCNGTENDDDDEEDDDPMNPFVSYIFKELLQVHSCRNQSTRMRVCYCIKKILQSLGPEASIDSEICDEIYAAMLDRLKDKSPLVRAQAVTALERLQDPSDSECPVLKAFLFHLCMDPSPEVRRAVLVCLGRSKHSISFIRNRIHDIKDTVRKQAYVSLSKVSVRSHSIKNRELILSQGLKDRSDMVLHTVEKVLLPNWFENCHENFVEFLHVLDVENSEIAEKTLKVLFGHQPKEKLIDCLDLDAYKLIPSEKLTVELSFYWRCLADYLQSEEDGQWELVLPDLSLFCEYVQRNLHKLKEVNQEEKLEAWQNTSNDFIVLQLLHLTKVFDLADEVGREKLKQLLLNMLLNSDVRLKLVPTIMDVLVKAVPDVNSRLLLVAETISEIHDPLMEENVNIPVEERREIDFKLAQLRVQKNILEEDLDIAVNDKKFLDAEGIKNNLAKLTEELEALSVAPKNIEVLDNNRAEDPGILSKCLTIVYEMMQSPSVKTLSPQLRSLMDNFVKNSLKVEHAVVQVIALQCLAVFALLDETFAKDVIVVFCLYLGSTCDEIALVAAKGIFDLLLMYGLKTFCITEEDETFVENESKKKKKKNLMRKSTILEDSSGSIEDKSCNESNAVDGTESEEEGEAKEKHYHLLSLLTKHLDSAEGQLLGCVVEGLCKLLLAMRISSPKLITRLILLWFNPVHEDDTYLRQVLGLFFKMYAVSCPLSQETLEQSFLPTIDTIFNAPCSSPLYQVNVETVAKFLLDLTKSGVNKYSAEVNIHNNLALNMCNELLLDNYDQVKIELINILCQMDLVLDEEIKKNLQTLAEKISKNCPDRATSRGIQKFQNILNSEPSTHLSEAKSSDNSVTLNSTTVSTTKRGSSSVSRKGSSISSDKETGRKSSRNDTLLTIPTTCKNVIPETSSESDSDSVFM